ncbi:MAG TPA: response regulator [Vicinamibacterales bacterium]
MTFPGRQPMVLIADDDQDTRELYRACFDTSGYRTAEARTGSQTIVSALEILPDVLLTDYVLPDIDGLTIAGRLKSDARTAGIHILMVTGYATADLDGKAASAGVERVLLKPCLPQAVMREVARVVARPASSASDRRIVAFPSKYAAASVAAARSVLDETEYRTAALERVRDEFAALPGLALTAEQARLVFDLDAEAVEPILHGLVAEGFLARTPVGAYHRERRY